MSYRPRMPQSGSLKWARISRHKRSHMYTDRDRDFVAFGKHWWWGYRWLNRRSADNPRWTP